MQTKDLKIAIYSGDIPSTTFVERLIIGLADSGQSVFLFGALKKRMSYGKDISVYGYYRNPISKLWNLIKFGSLLFLFKNQKKKRLDTYLLHVKKNDLYTRVKFYPVLWHQPDIFHVQWAKGLEDWMWVQEFGIKLILSLRGAHINYSPIADQKLATMYRRNFPKVDAFHAVSKAIAQEAQIYGASAENIKVVYSGLERTQGSQNKAINTRFNILSVGRSHWIKGYHDALDAMKLLKNAGLDFEYTIIGGKDSEELQYQVADLKLKKEVQLLGLLPYSEVQKRMQVADVLLLSSVEEGIANVVLEAMQLGTLVVSTNCGGMSEVIHHGDNGFLVPIRDPERMANAILDLSQLSEEQKETIIENAKQTIAAQHGQKQMITGMMDLYANALCHPERVPCRQGGPSKTE